MMQTVPSWTEFAMKSVSERLTQSLLPATTSTGQVILASWSAVMCGSVSIMLTSGSSLLRIFVSAMPMPPMVDGSVLAPHTNSLSGTSGCSIANRSATIPPSL